MMKDDFSHEEYRSKLANVADLAVSYINTGNGYFRMRDAFNPNRSLEKASCNFLMTAIRKIALHMLDS